MITNRVLDVSDYVLIKLCQQLLEPNNKSVLVQPKIENSLCVRSGFKTYFNRRKATVRSRLCEWTESKIDSNWFSYNTECIRSNFSRSAVSVSSI